MYSPFTLPASPPHFHDRVYQGEIARLAGLAAMAELVAFTHGLLEETFFPHAPVEIHHHLSHAEQVEAFAAIETRFARSAEVKRLWAAVFAAVGLDPALLARDRLHLRFQPHQDSAAGLPRARNTSTVAFHRDSWGSNLYAQTNWWAPVYPITEGRTFAIYPDLWTRPVPNTSASFDLEALLARARSEGRQALGADDAIPHLSAPVDVGRVEPVVIDPGEVIVFSSAHAHAGLTRISLETRTLWIEDVLAGRGAANIDGDAPWMAPGWFRRASDGTKLTELLGCQDIEPHRR